MYDYFKGRIEAITDEYVVLENNHIGYRIYTSRFTIQDLNMKEDVTQLYTKLIVKEDDMKICGFSSRMELDTFEMLTSVSGVGTKVGLAILGAIDFKTLIHIIRNEDVNQLIKAPGVGKKTAQLIILKLKDKFDKVFDHIEDSVLNVSSKTSIQDDMMDDIVVALTALGYSRKEATQALAKTSGTFISVEAGIKEAFKFLM